MKCKNQILTLTTARLASAATMIGLLAALAPLGRIIAADAAGGSSFTAYGIITADSAATVATLRGLVSEQTRLVYDKATGKLLVFGPAADHELVRNALKEVNRAPRNLRIEVTFNELHKSASPGNSAAGAAAAAQQLLLLSGSEAALQIGETVPMACELLDWGRGHGLVSGDVAVRRPTASLAVSARIIGDGPKIMVTITPQLNGIFSARGDRLRFSEAATTVAVTSGEPLTIASFAGHNEFYQMFLAGLRHSQNKSAITITLCATAIAN